ncbi:MarC family protein [Sulfurovum sp. NBC37-1]|uniref:MarC family protein n=1 Tax=Sulfurovum sp. (strain NBC37-1) TaxID=387093 RepID=UPI0001587BE9|nr:MarC family protein [Sulfurovum sp. NBC37-1]BAF72234.1 multiple antibiotic transporter, MarC family [Sulfurovum sp. NBC37-1]
MTAYLSILSHDIIALITILNPIAAASIMVGMVTPPTPNVIRPIAFKATLTILIASLVTLFSGEFVFKLFGINVLSLKVIGGIILMLIAINMAYGQQSKARHSKEEADEATEKEDVSVIPLGIPILFGPGAIATIIVLNNNHLQNHSMVISYGLISAAIFAAAIVIYFTLRYAGAINRALGVTGMKILTRIMGLIVGAIAAQFIISGVKGLWGTM